MNINDVESKVNKLLCSDISGNEVQKLTGLTKVSYYRIKEKENLDNLKFSTVKSLAELYDKKEIEKLAIEDSSIEFYKFLELISSAVDKVSLIVRSESEEEKKIYSDLFKDLSKAVLENKTDFIPYFERLNQIKDA